MILGLRSGGIIREVRMGTYTADVERMMKRLFDSLTESGRRRYAAIEVVKLGHGGIEYIARVLGCDPKTIRRGLEELEAGDDLDTGRTRKKGADASG
jgi:predicted ArsR family transcriptional regulator